MPHNDILRRIRFIFNFNDTKMVELFTLPNQEITRAQISDWLKKDEDPAFVELDDYHLAVFLNGLINEKRGKKEGVPIVIEKVLDNNIILRKLKIALNFKDDDILEVLALSNLYISKHELSAFFRNPTQSQYRPCGNQVLRNFLMGLQIKYVKQTQTKDNEPKTTK